MVTRTYGEATVRLSTALTAPFCGILMLLTAAPAAEAAVTCRPQIPNVTWAGNPRVTCDGAAYVLSKPAWARWDDPLTTYRLTPQRGGAVLSCRYTSWNRSYRCG